MSDFAPERVFAALETSGVDYVTVGGFAAIAHGVVRATIDVDGLAVVVVSRNDLIRLKAGTGRDRDLLDIGDLLAFDE